MTCFLGLGAVQESEGRFVSLAAWHFLLLLSNYTVIHPICCFCFQIRAMRSCFGTKSYLLHLIGFSDCSAV